MYLVRFRERGWKDGTGAPLSGKFEWHMDRSRFEKMSDAQIKIKQAELNAEAENMSAGINSSFGGKRRISGPDGIEVEAPFTVKIEIIID